jgi:hypothetical protein
LQKIECHRTVAPTSITSIRSGIPSLLVDALNRMLAKEPGRRFSVAAEVRDLLLDLVDQFLDGGPPPPMPEEWFAGLPDLGAAADGARPEGAEAGFWKRLNSGFQRFFGRGEQR